MYPKQTLLENQKEGIFHFFSHKARIMLTQKPDKATVQFLMNVDTVILITLLVN